MTTPSDLTEEPLPLYEEHGDDILERLQSLTATISPSNLPILHYPLHSNSYQTTHLSTVSPPTTPTTPTDETDLIRAIIDVYFTGITHKNDTLASLLTTHNLVTPNTPNISGQTPLIAAITATPVPNLRMIRTLIDLGADVNRFGTHDDVLRTPLQVAAERGLLSAVKLLVETYHADDALVAPEDGQTALRLAVMHGHREVVDFLPARRGGEWRRWKVHHAKAVRRAVRAGKGIYCVVGFCVWVLPRLVLWTVPKHVVVLPVKRAMVWGWTKRDRFGGWVERQVRETPARIKRVGIWAVKKIKGVPDALKRLLRALQRMCKGLAGFLVSLATKRVPAACKTAAKWLKEVVESLGIWIAHAGIRFASLLHTAAVAVWSFFENIRPADVWQEFCRLLEVALVDGPATVIGWLFSFSEAFYKISGQLFGFVGKGLLVLLFCIGYALTYVPRKAFTIVRSIVSSIGKGGHEIMVWIDPKQ